MRSRIWPSTGDSVSGLGWELGRRDLSDLRSVEILLRRSADRGINLVAWREPGGILAERALQESGLLRTFDGHLILPRSVRDLDPSTAPRSDVESRAARLESTLPPLGESPGRGPKLWIEWDPADAGPDLARDFREALQLLVRRGRIRGWGTRSAHWKVMSSSPGSPMFVTRVQSLMMRETPLDPLPEGLPGLARDVLAGGRLAGLTLPTGVAPGTAVTGPPRPVRSLSENWTPVLRLGFLAVRGKRTLGQAAIRWAIERPGVYAALVPLPPPERFEEFAGWEGTPPLTPEELRRVDELRSGMPWTNENA